MQGRRSFHFLLLPFCFCLFACSVSKQISEKADAIVLKDSAVSTGHIGISIYEPATNKYWYNYNADRYFIPASNAKLFTLYAGMKYLGDSLVAARLSVDKNNLTVYPSGDPSFLNPEFGFQPLVERLRSYRNIFINNNTWASDVGSPGTELEFAL